MIILLPFALLGIGFLLYLIFAGATYALPLFVGLAAGLAGFDAGLSVAAAVLAGVIAFGATIATGRFLSLTLPGPARLGVALAFALPAAVAGYSVGRMFAALSGLADFRLIVALGTAAICAAVAAQRAHGPPERSPPQWHLDALAHSSP